MDNKRKESLAEKALRNMDPYMVRLKTKETPNAEWEVREVPHAHGFAVASKGCFFRAVVEDIEFGTIISEFRDETR